MGGMMNLSMTAGQARITPRRFKRQAKCKKTYFIAPPICDKLNKRSHIDFV